MAEIMDELMDANPCYAGSNPVYAEVTSAQRKAETLKKLKEFSIAGPKKTNKKCCALTVIFLFLILSLTGVAAIAALAYLEIANLQMQVRQLNESLSFMATSIDDLQADVLTKTNQLSSLQSSVGTLTTARGTTTTQLSSVQSSVDTLTTRVNSPVNIYQNCIQETRSCNLFNLQSSWRACTTTRLPVNSTGYYTTDMRCEYEANTGELESSVLRKNILEVWCQCDVTLPTSTGLGTVPTTNTGTCSVIVTRCPPITIP